MSKDGRGFLGVLCFWHYCDWEHFPITANRLLLIHNPGITSQIYTHKFTDVSVILGVSPSGPFLLICNYVVYFLKLFLSSYCQLHFKTCFMLYCTSKQCQNNNEYHLVFFKLKSLVFPTKQDVRCQFKIHVHVWIHTYTFLFFGLSLDRNYLRKQLIFLRILFFKLRMGMHSTVCHTGIDLV